MLKIFVFTVATFFAGQAFASYGTVDMQMALETIKDGVNAKAKLEKEFKEKQKMLKNRESEIKKLTDNYRQQAPAMSEQKRAQKEQEIQGKMAEFQNLVQQSQSQMQNREVQLTKPIIEALRVTIKEIAEKNKLELVYEKNQSGIFYSKDVKDITNDVIKRYNEVHK